MPSFNFKISCFLIFLALASPEAAHAFRLWPMEAEFSTEGSGMAQTFTVENVTKEKIAIELSLMKREIDIEGKETRVPTDHFAVYPEQLQLEPGEKRNVRVTWTGPSQLPREEAYRLIADQLPVQLKIPKSSKKAEANLKFILQYVASLYASSGDVRPKVRVVETRVTGSGGKQQVEVVLANEGTAHQLLAGSKIILRQRNEVPGKKATPSLELAHEQVKSLDAENILPGGKRKFIFPLPKELAGKQVDADIEIGHK